MKPKSRRTQSLNEFFSFQTMTSFQPPSSKLILDNSPQTHKFQSFSSTKTLNPFLNTISAEETVPRKEKKTRELILKELSKIQKTNNCPVKSRVFNHKHTSLWTSRGCRSQPLSPLNKIPLNRDYPIRSKIPKTPDSSPILVGSKLSPKIQNFMANSLETPITKNYQNLKTLESKLSNLKRRASVPYLLDFDKDLTKSRWSIETIEKGLQEDLHKELTNAREADFRSDITRLTVWKQDLTGFKKEIDRIINSFPVTRY
ncbi:unnamed protein product [Blepharisma stoltei]|uniref:Uncharacterized protein n=1 Tax=Blepharisma stoltei TaxID=1481888 RepID=A0AAU9JEH0_9CILI|nr:unnamed protein product [Blepharisma stoltei]